MFTEKAGTASDFRSGDIIILMATFIWASSAVYLKKIISDYNSFQIVLYNTLIAAPLFFLEAILWDSPMISNLDGRILGALLYQSLVTASFGFVAWNNMLHKYGAVALHSFIFIMPIAGVALGGLVLGRTGYPQDYSGSGAGFFRHPDRSLESKKRSTGVSYPERVFRRSERFLLTTETQRAHRIYFFPGRETTSRENRLPLCGMAIFLVVLLFLRLVVK